MPNHAGAALQRAVLRGGLAVLSRLAPVAAPNAMGALLRMVRPLLPVTRVADANLRLALPELDHAARRHTIRAMWDNLGRTAGELPHLADLPKDSASGPGWEMIDDHILIEQARWPGDLRVRPHRQLGDAPDGGFSLWHAVLQRLSRGLDAGCRRHRAGLAAQGDAAGRANVPQGVAGRA